MNRYFFHLYTADKVIIDQEGSEQQDINAARQVAITSAREMIAADVKRGHVDLAPSIVVEDEAHVPILEVPFASVFEVSARDVVAMSLPEGSSDPVPSATIEQAMIFSAGMNKSADGAGHPA